ncbi:hypothetical protein BT96DRAFT_680775 [Gymnopus androsaceus JB14]|uniref:Uncharacterized protein n=1 Tax=Gymnopus androsaceus JB14 TaxID=1447944 RepID=A0A6A4HNR2_9AGAR|nr:hypothetical protein BT96DRAFT_680775 [Gymnopus androsaceus JB14]
MFAHASNFQIEKSIFTTGPVNVTYQETHRGANHDQIVSKLSIADVLKCPSPSQYFIGREDILEKFSRAFSAQTVTLYGKNLDVLHDFARHWLEYPGSILVDASSAQTLNATLGKEIKEQALETELFLVLENADASVVEDYFHNLPDAPILVTSTQPAISSLASSTACAFKLPGYVDQQVISKLLSSIKEALEPKQRIVTLVANGGTGKTQAVLQFVSKNIFRFPHIWFFDASSNDTLAANFKELGNAAGVGENVKSVQAFLARMNQNWLCIFDNADDQQVFLKDYIPSCKHGNVIVTSRLTETSQMASPGWHIHLSNLNGESAVELLLKHANEESSDKNVNVASEVVTALGFHALAVSTAGAYIGATPTCTLQNYMAHFNKKRSRILNYRMRSLDSYERTMFSTFQLSFDQLSHPTQYLMQICSYLHPTAIPLEIFTRATAFSGSDTSSLDLDPPTDSINSMKEFLSLFEDEESWEDSVVELCRLSLASYDAVRACLIFHPVLHACACETVLPGENMFRVAMLLLGRAIPLGETNEDFQFRQKLVVHALRIQAAKFPTSHVQVALATVFRDSGFWTKTEKLEEEVLLLHKEVVGDRHPDTLRSMYNLGNTYRAGGKLEAAEKLQQEGLLLLELRS